jgi:hypothetical protein
MILALTVMSGCSVLSKQPIEQKIEVSPPQIIEVAVDDDICLFTSEPENFDYNCDMVCIFCHVHRNIFDGKWQKFRTVSCR